MTKLISIDPGKCKCGLVLVDLYQKRVDQAVVLNTAFLPQYVKSLNSNENISKVIIGNGTTSRQNIEKLKFLKKELIVVEEKNTTFRAKKRYFELFPIRGLKVLYSCGPIYLTEQLIKNRFSNSYNFSFDSII